MELHDQTKIGSFLTCGVRVACEPHGGDRDVVTVTLAVPGDMLRSVCFTGRHLTFEVLGGVERAELARAFRWLAYRLEIAELARIIHQTA